MAEEHHMLTNGDVVPSNISGPLFPHSYYIDPSEPSYDHYCRLLRSHGGHLSSSPDLATYHMASGPWQDRETYLLSFIDDCVRSGTILSIEEYRFTTRSLSKKRPNDDYASDSLPAMGVSGNSLTFLEPTTKRPREKMSKTTTKFTPEADNYLLEQVRMRPRLRTSHKFFEDLAKHDMLKGHTGNSVRSRFRAHLEHKLQYVFKTDDFDQLILDETGQKIPIEVSSAKTMKNKFTAEDDFHLCNDIIRHVAEIQNPNSADSNTGALDESKFSVSINFFDDYATRNPQHSSSSWRDRYRKFARPHGLQKYRDDYLRDCNTKEGPKPMKNMTSRKARDKGPSREISRQVKESKPKVQSNRKSKISELRDTAAAAVAAISANLLGGHHSPQMHMDHMGSDIGMSSRETAALDEEISGVKNSNIDDVLHDMSAIHPSLAGNSVNGDVDDIHLELSNQVIQDLSRDYHYLPASSTVSDLFTEDIFTKKLPDIMDKIKEFLVINDMMELRKLSEVLETLGLTEKFIGHVFRITSGNALAMTRYFEMTFAFLQEGKSKDLKSILFVENAAGFWTPQADEALYNGDLDSLSHMKEDDLTIRRFFLGLEQMGVH